MGVFVERADIKVGIGREEIEYIVLFVAEPVFPSRVPAFYKHLSDAILGGEIDVPAHVFVRSSMVAVGLHLGVIDVVELHGGEVRGV